ncbi:MAG TPA: S-layer family protein, partial [Chroococcales cyanobacterium]
QLANQPTPRIEVQPGAVLTVGAARNPASLFLVGGNVLVNGGTLQGRAGSRVEVAGFTGSGSVNFTVDGNILDLVFPFNGVVGADVTLTNQSVVNVGTRAEDADGILLVGGTVSLTNGSQLSTSTFGTGDAGIVFLQADNILIDTSSLFSTAVAGASGDAGGILLNANSISIRNAKLDTANSGSGVAGDMILNGRNSVSIVDSEITSASANNLPSNLPAGTTPDFGFIAIAASEGSVVFDNSSISTTNSGSGIAGDISISARDRVSIANSFSLDKNNLKGIFSQGNQGRIFIGASDTYASFSPQTVIIDRSILSSDNLSSVADGNINAGEISIQANDEIFLTNSTQLSTSTFRPGSAGDVSLKTNGSSVSLDNSRIFSTVESGGIGNGGRIEIDTDTLSLYNGAQLQAIVRSGGTGDPGIIYVNATDSVSLGGISPTDGKPSGIFSAIDRGATGGSGSQQFAGGIFDAIISDSGNNIVGAIGINTGSLSLTDGAQLNTSTDGAGNAGAVLVLAKDKVSLTNGGAILSAAGTNAQDGDSGAILLGVGSLSIDGTSGVPTGLTTQTNGDGDAGLILVAADGDISIKGSGSGIFSTIEEGSKGDSGGIVIEARDLFIKDEAEVSVSNNNLSSGTAGDIYLTTRDVRLEDGGKITARTLSGNGGNLSIDARDLLVLTNSSNISTEAGRADAGGNGGNIEIKTQYIVAAPVNDSNIIAQAYTGNGGSISVSAAQLYKIAPRTEVQLTNDIDASSRYGQDGLVTTNVLNVDPTQGLNSLSENPVDPSRLIAQQCAARSRDSGEENKFVVIGRGGLPANPNNTLQNESVVTDWVGEPPQENPSENNNSANPDRSFSTATTSAKPSALVEAQGWVIGEKGEIILTANAPTVIPHDLKLTPDASCNGS